MNCESATFLERGVKDQTCLEIDVLSVVRRMTQSLFIVFQVILREGNCGYVLSSSRKTKSSPTCACAVGTFVEVM